MDKKSLARVEIKDAALGQVEAVFATLGVVDKDGDVTVKGALKDGTPVRISSFGHKSWDGALPVGKGVIHERGNEVVLQGQFFMNTTQGRDHFEVVKEMSAADGPGMEWSYGFDVMDSAPGEVDGKSVRILKAMNVHEVSPVMLGAGVGTRTTSVKQHKSLNEEVSSAVSAVRDAIESAERVVALRAEKGKQLSQVNRTSLDELAEACDQLKNLFNAEQEDDNTLRSEYLRFIASEQE